MNKRQILSVSSSSSSFNCRKVIDTLKRCGIPCVVTETNCLVEEDNNVSLEKGCKIELATTKKYDIKKDVWSPIHKEFKLKCAHLRIDNEYSGCIHDY